MTIGGGAIRFAAVMVPNTGKDAKAWWWYYGLDVTGVINAYTTNNARLVQINSYVTGGVTRYAVIMISNTGNDNKGWWWYAGITPAQIGSNLSSNNARLVDVDYVPASGNYNVIMESCSGGCPAWAWWYGQSPSQVLSDCWWLSQKSAPRLFPDVFFGSFGATSAPEITPLESMAAFAAGAVSRHTTQVL